MKEKKVLKSRRRNGFLLLLLPYFSISGELINNGMIDFPNYLIVAFINVLFLTTVMIIIPLFFRLFNGSEISYQKGRKICLINSIVLLIISLFFDVTMNILFIGGLGVIVYYFVNMFWFVLPKDFSSTVQENIVEKEESIIEEKTKMYSFSRGFVVISFIIIIFLTGIIDFFVYLYFKDRYEELQTENINLTTQNNNQLNKINQLWSRNKEYEKQILENENKVNFMDKHVVIVPANTNIFHKYDCQYLDISNGGLVYNPENAKSEGYVPCSRCIK